MARLPPSSSSAASPGGPAVLIHAGAGGLSEELRTHEAEIAAVLRDVLETAGRQLMAGADALEVAAGAVSTMEDFELFNAGIGAALCADGSVELSASLMRGGDRAAGAVAGVRRIRHPIRAAQVVLGSPQVLLIGQAAEEAAVAAGLQTIENRQLVTDRQRARLRASPLDSSRGTVGAVCLDRHGGLAAATSTGGIDGQPPGRVGDSPLLGAGTWADARVAVSCTGDGEAFIRSGVARGLAGWIEIGGLSVSDAASRALGEVIALGGNGGLIALAADGSAVMRFSTQAMPRGLWQPATGARVHVSEPGLA